MGLQNGGYPSLEKEANRLFAWIFSIASIHRLYPKIQKRFLIGSRGLCWALLLGGCFWGEIVHGGTQSFQSIKVEGSQRIEKQTILSKLGLTPGHSYEREELDTALKKLFATGFFSDAILKQEGSTLIVRVVENPIVNQLALEGNDVLSDEILGGELQLKPRQIYTLTRLKSDTQRIQDMYRLKGHFAALVTPKIIRRDQNRVDVIFEINEGKLTVVEKIFFVGNKKFSDSKLESVIQTKETRWYRFFTTDDNYDPDRVSYDRELLRRFYLEHGYADFRVKSAVAELSSDQKEFFITFTLEEGERYTFGKVDIASELKEIDVKTFQPLLTMSEGDWYSSKEVDRTITKITDALGNRGYAFVDVKPKINKHTKDHKVDITFDIDEGPRVYIDRIRIVGNIRTDEDVIRRKLRFHEGDAFNTHYLKMSERDLKDLGFFKSVKLTPEPSYAPDLVTILIEVEEQRTGELSLAGGFSTTDGPILELGFAEHNFRGRGQDFQIRTRFAKRAQEYELSFLEPYFLERELWAGFDIYHTSRSQYFDQAFTHKTTGGNLKFGYNLSEFLSQSWGYSLQQEHIQGVHATASQFIKAEKKRSILSSVSHGLHYDRRDSRLNPTEGYDLSMQNSFAGVGGDVRHLKTAFNARWYYPVADDMVFSISGTYGLLFELGKPSRVVDRYTLSLRGFEPSGISPRDVKTNDPLGGLEYYLVRAGLAFPMPFLPTDFKVKCGPFVDSGSVYRVNLPQSQVSDKRSLRVASGFGIEWASPVGLVRVDIGKALLKAKGDREQLIQLGMSTAF